MSDTKLEDLDALAAVTTPANLLLYVVDLDEPVDADQDKKAAWTLWDSRYLRVSNNLSDVANTVTARSNLGVAIGTNVQAYDAFLTSIADLGTAANKMIYTTGVDTAAEADLTAYGRSLIAVADEAAFKALVNLEIGTDVQAYDAGLTSIAGLTTAADKMIYTTALDSYAVADLTAFARTILDDANAAAVRTTLGLGTMAAINDAPSDGFAYGRKDAAWARAAGLALANTFTAAQYMNVNSATALLVEQTDVYSNVLLVNTNSNPPVVTTTGKFLVTYAGNTFHTIHNTTSGQYGVMLAGASGTVFQFYEGGYFWFNASANVNDNAIDADKHIAIYGPTGHVGLGTYATPPNAKFHIRNNTTTTNAVVTTQIIGVNSTGTPMTNFGPGLLFAGKSSTTADQNMAQIEVGWNDPANATRSADIIFKTVHNAVAITDPSAEKFRIVSDGGLEVVANLSTDVAPNDDTTKKKLTIQRLAAAPTNAAYIQFSNGPGSPANEFYLVLEEG